MCSFLLNPPPLPEANLAEGKRGDPIGRKEGRKEELHPKPASMAEGDDNKRKRCNITLS